jgi:hypothetical protein
MTPVVFAAVAFLPVTLMVAVAVLKGAVGLTNRFLVGRPAWAGDGSRSAWYAEAEEDELPDPGLLAAVVPTAAAAAVAAAALFGYGYLAALAERWPFITAGTPDEVAAYMARPYALLAAVPVFVLFRTRALAGLLRTTFPRAAAVVAFEVLIWGMLGATAMAARAAAGYSPALLV